MKETSNARWQRENKDKVAANQKRYREKNPERTRKRYVERYHADVAGDRKRVYDWRKENREKLNASARARVKKQKLATPKWLTDEELLFMKLFRDFVRLAGLSVDHILPIQGKEVSGLHVPWNLQELTRSENSAKGRRILTTYNSNEAGEL